MATTGADRQSKLIPTSALRDEYRSLIARRSDPIGDGPGEITLLLTDDEVDRAEATIGERLRGRGLPPDWARVGVIIQDQWMMLVRDAVRFPDGSLGTYNRFVRPEDSTPGVVILPVWQGKIVLLRQYRHAVRAWCIEAPRGFGDPDHTSEMNARRELGEEIGGEASQLILLGSVHSDTGSTENRVDLFFAELKCYGSVSTKEGISHVLLIDLLEFEQMISRDEITDGFTLAAFLKARMRGVI